MSVSFGISGVSFGPMALTFSAMALTFSAMALTFSAMALTFSAMALTFSAMARVPCGRSGRSADLAMEPHVQFADLPHGTRRGLGKFSLSKNMI